MSRDNVIVLDILRAARLSVEFLLVAIAAVSKSV